jgi:hypothetical protein
MARAFYRNELLTSLGFLIELRMRDSTPIPTRLLYLDADSEPPVSMMTTHGDDTVERQSRGRYSLQDVVIRDARELKPAASLEREGFELHKQFSKTNDFYDDEQVRSVYYPEIASLLESATGANEVVVFDHNTRAEKSAPERDLAARDPVQLVHNDFTEVSGPDRVKRELGEPRAARLLAGRLAIINVWRPIVGPLESKPLAMCDAQSLGAHDLVAADMVYANRTGSEYRSRFSINHRWYYYPRLSPDEVLFIKVCDTAADGRARFCLHSAFDDPTSPANAAPRESIELRAMAFF